SCCLPIPPPPSSTLFPYTTLFRSDNITEHSDKMPWYNGPSLLEYLDQVEVRSDPSDTDFTMPMQRVCRPDSSFRGFQGQIESGRDRKSTRLNSSHVSISYAVFCLK